MVVYGILTAPGVRYDLEAEKVLIGRSSDCEIVSEAKGISRKHAVLDLKRDSATITDLESVNGTFVNGTRLKPREPHYLKSGDIIVFSAYEKKEYTFDQPGQPRIEEAPPVVTQEAFVSRPLPPMRKPAAVQFMRRPVSPEALPPAGISSSSFLERRKPPVPKRSPSRPRSAKMRSLSQPRATETQTPRLLQVSPPLSPVALPETREDSVIAVFREIEQSLGLEARPLPVFKRKSRILDAIRELSLHKPDDDVMNLMHELRSQRDILAGLCRDLIGSDDASDVSSDAGEANHLVDYLCRTREALIEAERRENVAKRRWQDLMTELKAKSAELKVYKDARSTPNENSSFSTLRFKLESELGGDIQRKQAAEVIVSALEESERKRLSIESEYLRVRAKLAAATERSHGVKKDYSSDKRLEQERSASIEEVVRLKRLIARFAIPDVEEPSSPPPPPPPPPAPPAPVLPVLRRVSLHTDEPTPQIRPTTQEFLDSIEREFAAEMERDSQIPHNEDDEAEQG